MDQLTHSVHLDEDQQVIVFKVNCVFSANERRDSLDNIFPPQRVIMPYRRSNRILGDEITRPPEQARSLTVGLRALCLPSYLGPQRENAPEALHVTPSLGRLLASFG